MKMKRATLIVNPVAGKKRIQGQLFSVVRKFSDAGCIVTVRLTKSKGEATEIAAELSRDNCDVVICAGGDGTLNEVICGIMKAKSGLPIGYIPCGSTNDFAQSMKIPTKIPLACDKIIKGKARYFDIGLFGGKRNFSYIASFGAFTETSYNTSQSMKNALGHFAYILEGIKSLGNIKTYRVTVEADGKTVTGDYIFGAVSNSTSIAGVLKLKPEEVDVTDGIFEVILAKKPNGASEFNELIGAVLSANLKSPMLEYFKASKVEFISNEKISWTLDGEQMNGAERILIENLHDKIKLIR